MKEFDYIVVGTGQATGTLLRRLIPTGASIAVIEGHKVGGSCVNYGCTPTKALVASAKAIHQARRGDEYGFKTGDVVVDYDRVRQRMNDIRSNEGMVEWLETTENVTLIRGWAEFESDKVLRVQGERLTAENIFINVGTRPIAPPIDGLDEVGWMDSEGMLDLERLPDHLIVIGGGYIGVEFSQMYRRFGSRVTLLQKGDRLMPQEDDDISDSILELLESEDVDVVTGSRATAVADGSNGVRVTATVHGETRYFGGSHLMLAAGRRSNSDRLNLGATAIQVDDDGFIEVDEYCQTGVEGVFAVGDVNGHGAFTHTAVNDAEIVLDHLFGGPRKLSTRVRIYALFSDPPLGRVGLTEREAVELGHNVLKAVYPMKKIARAKEMSETHGMAKLLVDADTDRVLGAAIHGPGGDEIINMFATIIHSDIPCLDYRQVVMVHPTISEMLPFILDGLEPVEA